MKIRLLIVFLPLLLFNKTKACDCPFTEVAKEYIQSDFVGEGRVKRIFDTDTFSFKVEIELIQVFKGYSVHILKVLSAPPNSAYKTSCDMNVSVGESWLFFAKVIKGVFQFAACSNSSPSYRVEKRVLDFLENPDKKLDQAIFEYSEMGLKPRLDSVDTYNMSHGFKALNGLEGTVFLEFTIDSKGDIVEKTIIRSHGEEMDKRALEIAGAFRKAKPGAVGATMVTGKIIVPIRFIEKG